jgi:hypothetical protein
MLHVAQARVWGGHPVPDEEEQVRPAVKEVVEKGMPFEDLAILVMVAEAWFRPIRVVALEIESLLQEFFALRGHVWPDSQAELYVAERDFLALWEAKAREVGEGWVLAGRRRPLPLAGRPGLYAPKVVGAAVAERLQRAGADESAAIHVAAKLCAALGDQPAGRRSPRRREDAVKHWRDVFRGIRVRVAGDEVPLTVHLTDPSRLVEEKVKQQIFAPFWPATATPSDLVRACTLPVSACAEVAGVFWRRGPVKWFACHRCDSEEMLDGTIWRHLANAHRIGEDAISVPEDREVRTWSSHYTANELRLKADGTLVATWRNVPPGQEVQSPPPGQSEKCEANESEPDPHA